MTPPLPHGHLLKTADPLACRHRRVRVWKRAGILAWGEEGPDLSFAEMSRFRREPIAAKEVAGDLHGPGFLAANLGVSAAITVDYQGWRFALVTFQGDRQAATRPHQLLSGYREAGESIEAAAYREVTEEALIHDGARYRRLRIVEFHVPAPEPCAAISYGRRPLLVFPGSIPPYVRALPPSGPERIYCHAPSHSAQAVIGLHLELEASHPWTLQHCEDQFVPSTGVLESRVCDDGLRLVRLDANLMPRPEVYTLRAGQLHPVAGPIRLSEAFCPPESGVVSQSSCVLVE